MKATLIVIAHYVIWLILALSFYFMYITSMASALGIPERPWVWNDLKEGIAISLAAALILTPVSWSVIALTKYLLANR